MRTSEREMAVQTPPDVLLKGVDGKENVKKLFGDIASSEHPGALGVGPFREIKGLV
jgi:hypothetical protein